MKPDRDLMTPEEVRERLGICDTTLRDWRRDGVGPPWVRASHRIIRYPVKGFQEWLDRLTAERGRD